MRRRRTLRSVTVGDWGLYFAFLIPPLLIGLARAVVAEEDVRRAGAGQVSNGMTGAQVARADPRRQRPARGPGASSRPAARSRITTTRASARSTSRSRSIDERLDQRDGRRGPRGRARDPAQGGVLVLPLPLGALPGRGVLVEHLDVAARASGFLLNAAGLFLARDRALRHRRSLPVRDAAGRVRRLSARRRAGRRTSGWRRRRRPQGVKKVLNAAALTYVAGALAALTQLLYFVLVFLGNRD